MADDDHTGENQVKKEGGGEPISIKVKDQQGGEVVFRVKQHTKFERIFKAFCEKKSIDTTGVRFIFDGNRVTAQDTPADLEMEDGDSIDAVLEQVGGC